MAAEAVSKRSGGLIGVSEIDGRGRSVVSLKPLSAGQVVLRDSPILVYSAAAAAAAFNHLYCSNCFRRLLVQQPISNCCPSCSLSHFCSDVCQSVALSTSHTPWVCQSLSRLHQQQHLDLEIITEARFLIAAYNLSIVSPSDFSLLLSLHGDGSGSAAADAPAAVQLHSLISSLCPPPLPPSVSLEMTRLLLAKDKFNSFGLMEPFSTNTSSSSSVRAYAIYPLASFFNHDCLPNACRFDYLDSSNNNNNTDIVIRMIHDVPTGREICLSYFPVNLNYSQRQNRLLDDYGFVCHCDRCQVESNWPTDNEDDQMEGDDNQQDDDDEEAMDEDPHQLMLSASDSEAAAAADDDDDDDFPHAYFFARYMCNRNNCWGTLAPLPPSDANPSKILECNVCGTIKETCQADGW